jgi:hypothetical protein
MFKPLIFASISDNVQINIWTRRVGEGCRFHDLVTYRPICRQRLGKHPPAQAYAYNWTSIARQRISQHALLTIEAMFSVWSMQSSYKEVFGRTQ